MFVRQDLGAATQLIIGAIRLHGPSTVLKEGRFAKLSTARLTWFVGVQLVRIAVAISLGVGGTGFLARTISFEGLLRTTVALKFEWGLLISDKP